MTEPAEFDSSRTPAVTLAGRQWPIPELAVRQLREVRAPLLEFNERIRKLPRENALDAFTTMAKDEFNRLVIEPVFWGLTRAHPKLTMDEFLDMPISDMELIAALGVVQKQSGLFIPAQKMEGNAPQGEAKAAESQS